MELQFQDFINDVPTNLQPFVLELDEDLRNKGCDIEIKNSKSGFVVSYTRPNDTKKLLNYIFRKTGMKMRIYAANVATYQDFLNELPDNMKKDIIKCGDCKKLNGLGCCASCPAGYAFVMDGQEYKKCRNMAFLPSLNETNNPYIKRFIENELR